MLVLQGEPTDFFCRETVKTYLPDEDLQPYLHGNSLVDNGIRDFCIWILGAQVESDRTKFHCFICDIIFFHARLTVQRWTLFLE